MKNEPEFDFTVDKSSKTVVMNRVLNADLSLVWDAFTKKEMIDRWWAPKPWTSRTKVMDFKTGGRRFYAMVSPEGAERWQVQKYISIVPKTNFRFFSAFADKDENADTEGSNWDFTFTEQGDVTKVTITITNESLPRLEKMIEMGFEHGFKAQIVNLEELLRQLKK